MVQNFTDLSFLISLLQFQQNYLDDTFTSTDNVQNMSSETRCLCFMQDLWQNNPPYRLQALMIIIKTHQYIFEIYT